MLWTAADTMALITQNRSKSKLPKQQLQIDHVGILAYTNAQCCVPWLLAFRAICEAGRKPYCNLACQCHRSSSASLTELQIGNLHGCPKRCLSCTRQIFCLRQSRESNGQTLDMHKNWNWMGWDGMGCCGLNGTYMYSNIHRLCVWCV